MDKKPLALFSGIAAAGVLALGVATFAPSRFTGETTVAATTATTTPEAQPAPQQPVAQTEKPAVQEATEQQVAVVAKPAPEVQAPAEEPLPSFDTVRVEPTGEAVIAGRAEPGASIAVKFNGQVVGEGVANSNGEFAIIPEKKLDQGTGALTLVMTKNGAITESAGSVVISVKENAEVMVAKVDPEAPTNVTQLPVEQEGPAPKDVQLNAVDYDSAGNIVFTGRAAAGSVVRFYVDNKLAGDVTADPSGRWIFKGGEQVPPGQHTLRADQLDSTGKVMSRIELPFLRETEEAVAAAQAPAKVEVPAVEAQPAATEQPVAVATAPATPETAPIVAKPAAKLTEQQMVPQRIVIQPGHNLWKLSRQIYGRGKLYTVIYKANKDQLRSPHRVYPGQILAAPIRKASN